MERPGGSHWLECSHYLELLFHNFTPYYVHRFEGVLLGGWMEGVFTFAKMFWEKTKCFFFFLLKCL